MEVGGCDLVELAREHGTPLYVYDEATVRQRSSEYIAAMSPGGQVLYSAKAFASPQFLRIVAEEGLGLDVVSAGELDLALRSGFPKERIHFLGNNKSRQDLEAAYGASATIVIDGAYEFELLRDVVPEGKRTPVMLRISPGVKPDTHDHISTGQLDSKFGFSIESGAARKAVELNPSAWQANSELSRALLGLNRAAEAETSARAAVDLQPGNANLHLLLANIHMQQKNDVALLDDLNSYLKLAPTGSFASQVRQQRDEVEHNLADTKAAPAASGGAVNP